MTTSRRPTAAVALLVLCLLLPACAGAAERGGQRQADPRAEDRVDCTEMLAFLATDVELPGEPACRRAAALDTFYEAELTADPDDVVAWLAEVHPGVVLTHPCAGEVDLCVQVRREPDGPGRWHYLDVHVTGRGPGAAVRLAAFTT